MELEYTHNTHSQNSLADTPTIPHLQNEMATCYYAPQGGVTPIESIVTTATVGQNLDQLLLVL